jgi:NADH:ubiquinone oxidoreductase subunit F (NADH-binding)
MTQARTIEAVPAIRSLADLERFAHATAQASALQRYVRSGGYSALHRTLRYMRPADLAADLVADQRCRAMATRSADTIVCICRSTECLSGGIHAVIEGMTIAAYAAGATHGVIACDACTPSARDLLDKALAECRTLGLLGDNIFDSGCRFALTVVSSAHIAANSVAWTASSQIWAAVPGIIVNAERYEAAGLQPKTRAAAAGKI